MENDDEIETLFGPGDDAQRKYRDVGGARYPVPVGIVKSVQQEPRKNLWSRVGGWLKPDWVFVIMLFASVFLAVSNGLQTDIYRFVPPPLFPKLALLLGTMVLFSALATLGAKLDRRHLDDYMFQMVANGAVIAIITTILVNMVWEIGSGSLPPITRNDLVAVIMASWSLGYFFYRIRGVNE